MKFFRNLAVLAFALVLLWGGYRAYRAHQNLVTLTVRDMEVRQVASKLQWQTWERIIVNRGVVGKVTLSVKDVPLEEVLKIVALQTSTRWTALYPIYSSGSSVVSFRKVVRGDIEPASSGWTNLFSAPAWRRGNGGFANNVRAGNDLVSARFDAKDLGFATLALSRFSQAQVVAEDRLSGTVNLRLEAVPFEQAVAKVAHQVNQKWDRLYTLQPLYGPAPMPAGPVQASSPADPEVQKQLAEQRVARREREFEAMLATMTPQEREKAIADKATAEELRALPPEARQQRMQELGVTPGPSTPPDMMQRIQNRLKNSTPDQRVEADRTRLERKKKAQSQ